jgi:hypothetical protein
VTPTRTTTSTISSWEIAVSLSFEHVLLWYSLNNWYLLFCCSLAYALLLFCFHPFLHFISPFLYVRLLLTAFLASIVHLTLLSVWMPHICPLCPNLWTGYKYFFSFFLSLLFIHLD